MPVVTLRVSRDWYKQLQKSAASDNKSVDDFVLDLLTVACPPPGTLLDEEDRVITNALRVCEALESAKRDLVQALTNLKTDLKKGRNPKTQLARRHLAAGLRAALKRRGITQSSLADDLEVSQQAISQVLTCRVSLPPAWLPTLTRTLGDDWMSE